MKTFIVLIACMLALAAAQYNEELSQRINQKYEDCAKEQGMTFEPRFETLKCAIHKFGAVINEHGAVNRKYSMEVLGKIINDPEKVQLAQRNIAKCIDDANEGPSTTNEEKTDDAIRCGTQYTQLYINFPTINKEN